ncbi:hypothetical protein [Paraburkholderia panacisoli]|jgi:hypothetical protein|uniref:hypothetical protein n=1 Tax=Paraburkholderia panacisoli TaxID=2603818 RepID=UPI001FE7FA8C|nr:hypothetical protein [Paraburkholderia panacisoli]
MMAWYCLSGLASAHVICISRRAWVHAAGCIVSAEYAKVRASFDRGTSNQGPARSSSVKFNWYENVALMHGLRDALSIGASSTAFATDRSRLYYVASGIRKPNAIDDSFDGDDVPACR